MISINQYCTNIDQVSFCTFVPLFVRLIFRLKKSFSCKSKRKYVRGKTLIGQKLNLLCDLPEFIIVWRKCWYFKAFNRDVMKWIRWNAHRDHNDHSDTVFWMQLKGFNLSSLLIISDGLCDYMQGYSIICNDLVLILENLVILWSTGGEISSRQSWILESRI